MESDCELYESINARYAALIDHYYQIAMRGEQTFAPGSLERKQIWQACEATVRPLQEACRAEIEAAGLSHCNTSDL